jgi:hypothetical protein
MPAMTPHASSWHAEGHHAQISGETKMLKSLIVTLALASVAATGFAGLAQAQRWSCPFPITKGGCPVVISRPGPKSPQPNGD